MPTSRDHMVVVFESGVKYHKPQNQTFTYNYEAIKIQGKDSKFPNLLFIIKGEITNYFSILIFNPH